MAATPTPRPRFDHRRDETRRARRGRARRGWRVSRRCVLRSVRSPRATGQPVSNELEPQTGRSALFASTREKFNQVTSAALEGVQRSARRGVGRAIVKRSIRWVCAAALVASAIGVAAVPASAAGTCSDYKYKEDATADIARYPGLDRDHDGVACESLPSAAPPLHRHQHQARGQPPAHARLTRQVRSPACTSRTSCGQPDPAGLAFWVDRCNRRISSLVDVSDAFAGSPEFNLRYGALDNPAFVTLVYKNVLDRAPDAGGLQASVDFLGRGARRGEVDARVLRVTGVQGEERRRLADRRARRSRAQQSHRRGTNERSELHTLGVRRRLDRRGSRRVQHASRGSPGRVARRQ